LSKQHIFIASNKAESTNSTMLHTGKQCSFCFKSFPKDARRN